MTSEAPPETSSNPDNSRQHWRARFFRGRKPGPLLSSLAGVLIVGALVLLLEQRAPVLRHVLKPVYAVIGFIAFIVIIRWFRGRHRKRRVSDRRLADRRDADD